MASILKVDTITGVTTAGSIAITGEGNSTTTNLQQGLTKAFIIAESDATDIGSFNISGTTDNGTGDYTYNLTNNMNDNKAVVNANCSQNNDAVAYNNSRATDDYHIKLEENGSAVDRRVSSAAHGDLA